MKQAAFAATVALFAFGPPDASQAASTPRIVIRPPVLLESNHSSVLSAGEDVVGLSAGALSAAMRNTSLQVSGIRPQDGFLCVYIERASGLYTAEFSVPNPQGGPNVVFQLETHHLMDDRPRYGEYAIAVQPSMTARCSGLGPFLPVAWIGQSAPRLSVMINSQQATYIGIAGHGEPERRCQMVGSATGLRQLVARSFDTVCDVAPPPCGQDAAVTVFRRDGGDSRKPVKVLLRGRC